MKIQSPETALPASCDLVRELSASDGRLSRWGWPVGYAGSEEEAIAQLKKEAAEAGANLLVIDPDQTVAEMGLDALRGSVITVYATAYRCPRSIRESLNRPAFPGDLISWENSNARVQHEYTNTTFSVAPTGC